jgi:NAD(P)-dependent dehydrogenase (short-subunit alcohol dehydrogenase family)
VSGLLQGRRALVTGAANGIGRAVVTRLVEEGARVGAVDVETEALEALAGEFGADKVLALMADVRDEAALQAATDAVVATWGGLDALVANAGIEPIAEDDFLHDLDAGVLRRVVDVNLVGMALTCKQGLRAMLDTGAGAIVCTASPTGLYGGAPSEAAYSIAKGGVTALVRVIASGYASRGIRANAVVPGFTDTRANTPVFDDPKALEEALAAIPLARVGTPAEVASVVSFLLSDEAAYVTGAIWAADGGATAI